MPILDAPFIGVDVARIKRREIKTRNGAEPRYRVIYRHNGTRWYVYSDQHGNPLASQKAADRLKAIIDDEIERGIHNPLRFQPDSKSRWRFAAMVEEWLKSVEARVTQKHVSPGTLRAYKTYVTNYLIPHFGGMEITDIRKQHISNLISALPDLKRAVLKKEIEKGRRKSAEITAADLEVAPKTQKHILMVLATFLNHCVEQEILVRAPGIPAVKVPRRAPRWTDQETQYRVLGFVPAKHKPFVEFNILHGFRPGESCALKVRDMAMAGIPAIRLEHSKTRITHYVPVHPKAVDMLINQCRGKLPDAPVFTYVDRAGVARAYTVGRLYRITAGALKAAALDLTPYEFFKHSKLTQAAQGGASTDEITAYAGWRSRAMADVYVNNDVRNLVKIHGGAEVVALKKKEAGK